MQTKSITAMISVRTRLVRPGLWLAVIIFLATFAGWNIFRPAPVSSQSSTGHVFVWGRNEFGQLGNGTNTDQATPVALVNTDDVIRVASGSAHTIALKRDGTVLAWGMNFFNQLGDGTLLDRNSPVPVGSLTDVIQIAAGGAHNLALKRDGTVLAWGYNDWGQVGDGTRTSQSTPVAISGATDVVAVAAGASFSLALKRDGTVSAWGLDNYGQLGDGGPISDFGYSPTPVAVTGLTDVARIAAGGGHALAIKRDGTLWAWGRYEIASDVTSSTPVQIAGVIDAQDIDASTFSSLVLRTDGTVLAWGVNEEGQLGNGATTDRTSPTPVSGLSGVSQVAAGDFHSMALKRDGTVLAWGRDGEGQLGTGAVTNSAIPVVVNDLTSIVHISAGTYHSTVLRTSFQAQPIEGINLTPTPGDVNWQIVDTADFNRDGTPDLLWEHQTRDAHAIWLMGGSDGATVVTGINLTPTPGDVNWQIVDTADFNRDGTPDLLWEHQTRDAHAIWLMGGPDGATVITGINLTPTPGDVNWQIVDTADFNRDGTPDLLWEHQTRDAHAIWLME